MSPVPTVERAPETARHPDHETSYLNGDDLRRDHHRSSIPDTLLGLTKFSAVIGFSDRLLTTTPPWHENGNVRAGDYRGDAGDAGAAPSRLRRPRHSERAIAGRRGGGATPADCGWFAMAKSNVAGFEYQYGGGTWRRKSSSAAFIAAMVYAA